MILQDYDIIQLDDWTQRERKDLFKLVEQKVVPYEVDDNVWVSVSVNMDLDRMNYSRSRYTALDLLSDVGGIYGIFTQIFGIFLAAWNFNIVENFMVSKLFRMKTPSN